MKPYFTCTHKKEDIECELLPTIYVDQDEDTISFRFLFWQIELLFKNIRFSFNTPRFTVCIFPKHGFLIQAELFGFRNVGTDFQVGGSFYHLAKYKD